MKRITELRKAKHLNQTGLGLQLNVSQKMISAYESGLHQPSVESLKQMSKFFNVSVDYIIENTDIKTPVDSLVRDGLTSDEIELLSIFKELNKKNKQRAIGMLAGLKLSNDQI